MDEERRHEQLQRLAARQWQVLSGEQIRDIGFSRTQVTRLVQLSILHHRHRGIYTYATPRPPWKGVLLAAQWSVGPDAWLSGRTALSLLGVGPVRLGSIDVGVPRRTVRARARPVQLRRSSDPPADLRAEGPLRFTTAARAIADLAEWGAGADDLANLITVAIHGRRLDHAEMRRLLSHRQGRTGTDTLQSAYAAYLPAIPSRSGLERSFDIGLRTRPGLGVPLGNHRLYAGGIRWEIDRYFETERVAVELHGGGYHHAREDVEKDTFKAVKLALVGVQVLAITDTRWELEPEACLDDLEAMLSLRRGHRTEREPGRGTD